ncbi:hypothetical protein BCR35DRAFT_155470 [Leucosporidium creatinivorum]|uniref:Uncharacterized protein n=1 Tax=Leucosporidium creatinivorum TaxID=106004 RepID=A0A1Y2FZK5_9BASI|nr:hypothetical protein BCR35DRAFT_155470 [Leucosporidium creatinivorum]
MAVIQDLPPELLRKILEHGIVDEYEEEKGSNTSHFRNTSLVVRAWTGPSQELLLYTSNLPQVTRFLEQHSTTPSPHVRVEKLVVTPVDGRELELLGRSKLVVEKLLTQIGPEEGNRNLLRRFAPV